MLFSNASASSNNPSTPSAAVKLPQPGWYNDSQKRWEGSAHSPDCVEMLVMINGKDPISVPVSGGRFAWTPSLPFTDGEYVLTFISVDAAKNQSAPVSVIYNLDTVAPDRPLIKSIEDHVAGGVTDGNAIKRNGYINDANPVVRGEAEANSLVYIYNKNSKTPLASVQANAQGEWETEVNLPKDGAYELSAVAADRANNRSQSSVKWKFQLDTEKPDGAAINGYEDDVGLISGSFDFSRPTDDRRPELYGTGEPDEYVRLQYASKNGSWVTTATVSVDSDGNWVWTPPKDLADGEWSFRARSIDHAGNVSKWSGSTYLVIDTTTIQPTILQAIDDAGSISNVFPGQTTHDARLDFNGKAEANSLVTLYQDSIAVGSTYANVDGEWKISPLRDMNVGLNNFGVKAIDAAGNQSVYSLNYQVNFNPNSPLDLKSLLIEAECGLFINDNSKQLMIDGNAGDCITLNSADFSDGWLISQNTVHIGGENWTLVTNSKENYTLIVNQEIDILYG
jgi:hypothetical protein